MLKYWGDIIEKLTAGALIVGLLQDSADGVIMGLIAGVLWTLLRVLETRGKKLGEEGPK